jgi:hypothetical protein
VIRTRRSGDRITVRARFSASTQIGPGARTASCTMGTRSFARVKRPGRVVYHPPHLLPRLKKEYSYTSTPSLVLHPGYSANFHTAKWSFCAILGKVVVYLHIIYIITKYTFRASVILRLYILQSTVTCLPQIQPLVRTSGYCGFILYSTLGHVGGGNSFRGYSLMRVATTHAG